MKAICDIPAHMSSEIKIPNSTPHILYIYTMTEILLRVFGKVRK